MSSKKVHYEPLSKKNEFHDLIPFRSRFDSGLSRAEGIFESGSYDACTLSHTKIESTVRYLGVDVEDALALAEHPEI